MKKPSKTYTSGLSTNPDLPSANETLRVYVEEMLHKDKRFVGLSLYVVHVNFFWSYTISTACAGHGFIFFNPNFWDSLTHEKKKTVIAHEIWHLVLDHLERGKDLDPEDYNIAGDHVINLGLKADGFDMKGKFGTIEPCCDPKFAGMSTEQVYRIIHKQRSSAKGSIPLSGSPSPSQIEDLVKQVLQGTGIDLNKQIEDNNKKREEAVAKAPGKSTGSEARLLQTESKKVFIKEASYEEIFEDYLIDPLSGGKRTYLRPSRRPCHSGLKLKGKYPKRGKDNRLTHLVYALDVSGSISSHQANQFLRSAKTLKEKLKPKLMTVMLWDTRIKFEKTFREDESLDNIRVQAGGGTCLQPVFARVKQINPEALVIFTDLEVAIPPKPEWEVIWFVTSKTCRTNHVTYGEVYLVPEP